MRMIIGVFLMATVASSCPPPPCPDYYEDSHWGYRETHPIPACDDQRDKENAPVTPETGSEDTTGDDKSMTEVTM